MISLLVLDIKKFEKSSLSIYRDVHAYPVKMEYGWNLWLTVAFRVCRFQIHPHFFLNIRKAIFRKSDHIAQKITRDFKQKNCGVSTYHRWNFKPQISFIFHFDHVSDGWMAPVLVVNTSYLTDSYISFTLKLESRQKCCSNMLIRSSTYSKKNISDFPACGSHFLLIHFTY